MTIIKGTLIDKTANRLVIGAAASDNRGAWPFVGPFIRGSVPLSEAKEVRAGHPKNGSGTIFDLTPRGVWMITHPVQKK